LTERGVPVWRAHEAVPGACYVRLVNADGEAVYLWAGAFKPWLRELSAALRARTAEQERIT
jgi:hypothetical protein